MNPPNHIRFIIACLTALALACAAIGGYLLLKGFQSGELFVGIVGTVTGGIVGMISMRPSATPPLTQSGAVATEVLNPPTHPVETHETTP